MKATGIGHHRVQLPASAGSAAHNAKHTTPRPGTRRPNMQRGDAARIKGPATVKGHNRGEDWIDGVSRSHDDFPCDGPETPIPEPESW